MTEKIVEFECVYGTAHFEGYAYVDELDDDEPIYFYGQYRETQFHLENADWDGNEEDRQKLFKGFTEDFLFVQFLSDFAEENVTIDRGDYTLVINEGTHLEMNVEKIEGWAINNRMLNAKISFKFGDTILGDDLLDELCEDIGSTWNAEGEYSPEYSKNAVCLEIDHDWWNDEIYGKLYGVDHKQKVEEEMLSDAETLFVRQLIMDKGVYTKYQDLLEKEYLETDDRRIFNKDYIRGAANNYEQILECENLEDLNNICEKEMVERMLADIKEDY